MKEIFNFILWQLKKWKWTDYLWFTGCGMMGIGWQGNEYVFIVGTTIVLIMMFGALISMQWERYKRDRNQLFDTIKNSQ